MEDYKLRRRGEPCLVPPVLGLYLKVVLSYAQLGAFRFSLKKFFVLRTQDSILGPINLGIIQV